MKKRLLEIFSKRRSMYFLTDKSPLSDMELTELLENIIKEVPSPFNSQSGRVILLLGDYHKKFWNFTLEILKPIAGANFPQTEEKVKTSFAAGYGTVLFFEDTDTVKSLIEKFPTYKDKFPEWSMQSNAMIQYAIWCAFTEVGIGANLQHYNPLVDEKVIKEFNVPSSWKLIAQMPFGVAAKSAGDKEFMPIEQRFKVIK